MKLEKDQLENIKRFFASQPVKKASLFGSYARNTANTKSDIDILVDLDYTKKTGLGFVQMKLDLEEIFGRKVDIVSSKGISKYLKLLVDKEKLLIYER